MTIAKKNALFALFASVQLTLFLLFLLASTSIIGTIIPQNNPAAFYVERYGSKLARFLQLLDIPDMYNSWWFLGLLALFAVNLIVCSADRIPQVIRQVRRDGLSIAPEQLTKLPLQSEQRLAASVQTAAAKVTTLLQKHGWRARKTPREPGQIQMICAEKGKWSRFGVYVVHCSILIILAGALLGSSAVARKVFQDPLYAFKGSIMLPEGETTGHVFAHKDGERLELGFALRCDDFTVAYYGNGMPKTYRSRVTVLEHGSPVQSAEIEVNRPLTYRGVTFYQSSYHPLQDYQVTLKKQGGNAETTARIPVAEQIDWPEGGVSYGIINRERQGEVTRRLKIWFTDNQGEPSVFWLHASQEAAIERPSGTYLLTIQQRYATGLQATKDPGVWLVYGGCLLMLAGLYIAFFLSHRKIYVRIQPEKTGCHLLFAGDANKNKVGFEQYFLKLISKLETKA